MNPRVLLAGLFHETHSFVEGTTGLRDFKIVRGPELLHCEGDSSPMGGVLESARKFGWTILPTVDYRASPAGMVEDEVVETFWREFRHYAEPELAQGVAAIYLVLHGAMVSQSLEDVDGEILGRIRALPGAKHVPVFGVFDLHANFTGRMACHSDCLVVYRENPHADARQAAQDAAALLQRSLTTGVIPKTFWQHPPVVWPPTGTGTASEPMRSLETLARQIEAEDARVWAVNVMGGFAFADTADTGVSLSLATTAPEAEARAQLARLCHRALEMKEQGNVLDPPIASVMAKAFPPGPGLTVLVEPSDNIGGGAPGDGTGILRALVQNRVVNAAVCLNDPAAVAQLESVPLGARLSLPLGGKGSHLDAGPLTLTVELVSKGDGKFQLEDKQSHLASMVGDCYDMGRCAVVRHEGITILLTSVKTAPLDLGQWRSQGIEPTALSVMGVKAAVAHRRTYDSIAARSFWVDTPGPCTSDLRALPYKRIHRPIFPLDVLPSSP